MGGVGSVVVDQEHGASAMKEAALRLIYMTGQITPEEFRWQDANYDRDSALGRELLYLIAENHWVRATSETVGIARSDMVETTIQVDIELDHITHEAFRGRIGEIWLPVLVLPPLLKKVPGLNHFSALTVRDATGALLPTLPNTDVRHRIAAALTEIIANMAGERLPDVTDHPFTLTRSHRLMLSAAVYRLLGREHVPHDVLNKPVPARHDDDGSLPRFARVRGEVGNLIELFSGLLTGTDPPEQRDADAERTALARQLVFRAIQVLRAFAESTVVVVAAERANTSTVLTVTVPSRPLHWEASGQTELDQPTGNTRRMRTRLFSWRWLKPSNWILPGASLRINLLLPSADTDRHIQVNLPDEISPDPSRRLAHRAQLSIKTGQPLALAQLGKLMNQLTEPNADPQSKLYQCLADLAGAKADAARESLRDYRVVNPEADAPQLYTRTDNLRQRLGMLREALRGVSAGEQTDALTEIWNEADDAWLQVPVERRVTIDSVSPGVVMAHARMIDDVNQRAAPTQATIQIQVALTDSVNFSVANIAGSASLLLMVVVLAFYAVGQLVSSGLGNVSPEVLAIVLTLFSAIQAGRLVQVPRSTMAGLLTPAGNPLILVSVVPSVILAVAFAFSHTPLWAISWAGGCIAGQLLLLCFQWLLLRTSLAKGLDPDEQPQRWGLTKWLGQHERRQRRNGPTLYLDSCDYSHSEVLHSHWWRTTVADALMVGRQAYGYVIWQHGTQHRQTLGALLHSGYPAGKKATTSRRGQTSGLGIGRRDNGPRNQSKRPLTDSDPGLSPLRQPANVMALQRSGTADQSLTFAVFRDKPNENLNYPPEDVVQVDLDPGHLAPLEEPAGVVGVFLGLPRGQGMLPVSQHPVTRVLKAAADHHCTVLEIQLPVPAPRAAYADLLWARVQLGVSGHGIGKLAPFLDDVRRLVIGAGTDQAEWPVMGIQTISEGAPRILNPRKPGTDPDQPSRSRWVGARDLDVVVASGVQNTESATARTWRVMAVAADSRAAVEHKILSHLPDELELAALTVATLHGKAVVLLLGHRAAGTADPGDREAESGENGMKADLDKWQSRRELGQMQEHPLLRVHMRTPDRPGATLAVLDSLRETFQDLAPGALGEHDWNIWYARVTVDSGGVATIQFTARLARDRMPAALLDEDHEGSTEFSRIERKTLALAARKMASDSAADAILDITADTALSVGLVDMPQRDQ
jgi:hypothetical protein